jgi:hypothetical protein
MGATAEFRKSPTAGYLCKDHVACKRRERKIREARR